MNIEDYFARISYDGPQDKLDLETLAAIFLCHIRAVPFENLSIHCDEPIMLELEAIYDKIVKRNRGGWCLENNQLLFWAFQMMGYEVSLLGSCSYDPITETYNESLNHLILKVVIGGHIYIVDGGFGVACQMWQPMELVSGKDQPQSPGIFRFTEADGVWYFDKLKRKRCKADPGNRSLYFDVPEDVSCKNIFSFTLQPRTIEEFQPAHVYYQTHPDSFFKKKSICSLQTTSGFQALIGWTFTEMKYNYKDNMDLVERTTLTDQEVENILLERFSIRLDKKFVPINISLV
ncbi:arylamine N-acetyltransferase, pineal gland isozyme NAT-3-like [Varanus komodoensis]|uniref:arylamine N-acetyltransferase, pineal gland isozyme NAT-3-like n=1 Tax=Varanus komodoensis TaxID=61221 RepID=UPI001CF7B3D0|nr:arylamine N-acetyltransferase, pineal gland isozyme NAT-3-like [Varanus komodoensis]